MRAPEWSGWERTLLQLCALFHVSLVAVMALLPYDVVDTEGTHPALQLLPQRVWAVVFAVAGVLVWRLLHVCTHAAQMVTWFAVFVPAGAWLWPLALAVATGGGSPVLLVFVVFLYAVWAILAFHIGRDRR